MYTYIYIYIHIYYVRGAFRPSLSSVLLPSSGGVGESPARPRRAVRRGREFQGYWLKDTLKGPQFEETKTQIALHQKFLEKSQIIVRKVKTVSLKSLKGAWLGPAPPAGSVSVRNAQTMAKGTTGRRLSSVRKNYVSTLCPIVLCPYL